MPIYCNTLNYLRGEESQWHQCPPQEAQLSLLSRRHDSPPCVLTGLTHSLPASVPSQKRALSLLPAHLLMLFGRTKAPALAPAILKEEVLGHIYELSCGGGNIITLSSGCLCVRLWTWRRGCLSCFFCLPCILPSICTFLWCLACLSCSFSAFFISLSVCGSSPPPHILIFFV